MQAVYVHQQLWLTALDVLRNFDILVCEECVLELRMIIELDPEEDDDPLNSTQLTIEYSDADISEWEIGGLE